MESGSIRQLNFILFIALCTLFFVNAVEKFQPAENTPPVDKKIKHKIKNKLDNRIFSLENKIKKTKSESKKAKLKTKLKLLNNKKENSGNPVFSIIGFVLSMLSIILLLSSIIALFLMLFGTPFAAALYLYYSGIVVAVLGLGTSITGFVLGLNKPDKFSMKGLALAGLIISSIVLALLAVFIIAY